MMKFESICSTMMVLIAFYATIIRPATGRRINHRHDKILERAMLKRLLLPAFLSVLPLRLAGFHGERVIHSGKSVSIQGTDGMLHGKGYRWVVYVKLLHGRPFIVGKSGTAGSVRANGFVKASPVDFDFVIGKRNDPFRNGPGRNFARRFLPFTQYMDHGRVLVRACRSEQDALRVEKMVALRYQLFQS